MSLIDRLEDQLRQRGLKVGPGTKPGELILHGPHKERTPELMKALKAFKPQLLAKYGKAEAMACGGAVPARQEQTEPEPEPESCPLCNRDVSDPEDRERLKGVNPFCTVGYTKAVTDGNGTFHPASPGCPYRGRDS
jgi:hypothetical protein